MKQIVALTCCRGNSKGLRDKNITKFHGKPMLYWIFKEIYKFKIFSKIINQLHLRSLFWPINWIFNQRITTKKTSIR